jgi:hypothetical protein
MGRGIKSDAIDSRRCEKWLQIGATWCGRQEKWLQSGSVSEPQAKKNKKFFSQPYIFRLPVIYPVKGFPSTTE